MEAVKELKQALKTWEYQFFKENGRKPNREDIGLASDKVQSAYSRYYKLKAELGQLPATPVCKSKPEEVWGQILNRSFEQKKNSQTPVDISTTVAAKKEQAKKVNFLEKLSSNMFINSKKCEALKKLTRHRSLSGTTYSDGSKISIDSEEVKCLDSQDDSLLNHSVDSIPNQDINTSRHDDFCESSTPQHLNSVSNDTSVPVISPCLFKMTPNISTPLKNLKAKKSFKNSTPDLFQHKQKRKFSISSSFSLEGEENTNSPYSGFEFYATPSSPRKASFSSLDSNSMEKSGAKLIDKTSILSPKRTISKQNEEDEANVCENSAIPNKHSFSLAACNLSRQKINEKTINSSNEEKLLSSQSLVSDTRTEDFDFKSFDDQSSQRKRMRSPDKESSVTVKRVKRKEIAYNDFRDTENLPLEDGFVDNSVIKKSMSLSETQKSTAEADPKDISLKRVKNQTTIKPSAPPKVSQINKSANFVRLNMKVKRYSKKGQRVKGAIYKRQQWKKKQRERQKSYGDKCFQCGQSGHWANKCTNASANSQRVKTTDNKPQQENDSVDEEEYPTVAEAAALARGVILPKTKEASADVDIDVESTIRINRMEAFDTKTTCENIEAFYPLNKDGSLPETTEEIYHALSKFGFSEFREGQQEAIMRTLCGLSTLVILSTGCGKSLCYQLPAYMYSQKSKCITVVVSPLVSLMEDQIDGLPPGIHGACLHTNMTKSQRDAVIAAVNNGSVHFLLLSPEAVVGRQKSVLSELNKDIKIAFACIDEAHCLSQWSHNFRPSYLQVCQVLKNKFGVNCFLGLTATATLSQSAHIAEQLWIQDCNEAVIRGTPVPKNLILSVSSDSYRDESLIEMLQGNRFSKCESIIIYCTRRDQTERIAILVRTCLKEKVLDFFKETEESETKKKTKKKKKLKPKLISEAYHAGLTAYQRKRIQNAFMSGQLWIIVATVAFGMGLDKSNVRGVIHYNMPKSFESYVQEIGRAGRDRKISHCHLFLDANGSDLGELKKHVYSNTVSRFTVKKFVQKILKPCRCLEIHKKCIKKEKENLDGESADQTSNTFLDFHHGNRICQGHERAVPIDPLVNELDLKQENIATLLCYLELAFKGLVKSLPLTYATCKVNCYGGPAQLQAIAKKCPPMGVAIARQKLEGQKFSNSSFIEFPVVELSDSMGWNSGLVKRELKMLQWNFDSVLGSKKSGVMVEFSDISFHFLVLGDLSDEEQDNIVENLYQRVTTQEKLELDQIHCIHKSLKSVSYNSIYACQDKMNEKRNNQLHDLILEYFDKTSCQKVDPSHELDATDLPQLEVNTEEIRSHLRRFLSIYAHEHNFTGHSIARIFHGIDSPCYPAKVWGRVRQFWRLYIGSDFKTIVNIAAEEIINFRH